MVLQLDARNAIAAAMRRNGRIGRVVVFIIVVIYWGSRIATFNVIDIITTCYGV
jgi:hypothetical protein